MSLPTLDECTCSCHRTGAVHIVACCTGVSKLASPYATEQLDVHKYRAPIATDCIVGCCSMNNCLYPDCSATYRALNNASRLV